MREMTDILGLVFPTNEPDTAFEYLFTTLENFKEVAPISTFLINYQKPWTDEKMQEANDLISSYGFKIIHEFNQYEIPKPGWVPYNKIRNRAAELNTNSILYALVEDDMTFVGYTDAVQETAGQQFLQVAHYMLSHPNCGLTMMGSSMYRRIDKYCIAPTDLVSTYVCGKGYVAKNLGGDSCLLPKGCLDLYGSDDEKLIAGERLFRGWYPAKMGYSKVRHYENFRGKNAPKPGYEVYKWNTREILYSNNVKYIIENYNPDYDYYYDQGNHLVSKETYIANGGIDLDNPEVVGKYLIDYTGKTSKDLLGMIKTVFEDNYKVEVGVN